MITLITATGLRKLGQAVARSIDRDERRREACHSEAAECQKIAGRYSGLVRSQYEELARQWLLVADLARLRHSAGNGHYY